MSTTESFITTTILIVALMILFGEVKNNSVKSEYLDQRPSILPKCVVDTVWNEAKGESTVGQLAVLKVIENRVEHTGYGDTWCGVVNRKNQFADTPVTLETKHYKNFEQSLNFNYTHGSLDMTMAGALVGDSLYFISKKNLDTIPRWVYTKEYVVDIGGHTFYK